MTMALEIRALGKRFGAFQAVSEVDLTVRVGERRLLLGQNGAGKTTLFNLLTGDLRANSGVIRLFGTDITAFETARRVHLGLSRTYQIITLFAGDTVRHNVALSLLGLSSRRWQPYAAFAAERALLAQVDAVLDSVGLTAQAGKQVSACSYGEKRRLEIALALAQRPRVLLLDEPLAGLSQQERTQIQSLLADIPRDITMIMIEHDMDVAMAFADEITLLHQGRVAVEGKRQEVIAHPTTREVYLGQ
ncbi:MAG: ABC transporter ATP-binding protein [Pseudomonadota bacterium]